MLSIFDALYTIIFPIWQMGKLEFGAMSDLLKSHTICEEAEA